MEAFHWDKKNAAPLEQHSKTLWILKNYLPLRSSETVSFLRPRALLLAKTALPLAEDILCLNPCLFVLLRRLG
jgi:hypothetical protein